MQRMCQFLHACVFPLAPRGDSSPRRSRGNGSTIPPRGVAERSPRRSRSNGSTIPPRGVAEAMGARILREALPSVRRGAAEAMGARSNHKPMSLTFIVVGEVITPPWKFLDSCSCSFRCESSCCLCGVSWCGVPVPLPFPTSFRIFVHTERVTQW